MAISLFPALVALTIPALPQENPGEMPSVPALEKAELAEPTEEHEIDTNAVIEVPEEVLPDLAPIDLEAEIETSPPVIEARPVAFADETDASLYDRSIEALASIDTLQARFIQVSPSRAVYEGELALRRPGQLRVDYDDPSPQLIVATNGLVYVHDSELETTDSYPVRETPLHFLLARKIDPEAAELRQVLRGEDRVTVVLASREEDLQGELALTFAADDEFSLLGWAVLEPDGAMTVVELAEVQTGLRLSNRLFRAPAAGGSFLRDR